MKIRDVFLNVRFKPCVGFQKLLRKRGLFLQWKQYGQKTQRLLICSRAKKTFGVGNEPQIQAALNLTSAGVAGESMKDWFEALGDKIYHIRFVDGRPQGCLAWGDGLRPLEDQLICLDQYKYKGLLSLALNDARYLEDPAAADRAEYA